MRRSAGASTCPSYEPVSSASSCSPITVAAISNEVDTGSGGRPWKFDGKIVVPIGSNTYDDWTLLIQFNQRVQQFDASFDSFRDRDNENDPIQQRWMFGPKKKGQPLTGDLEFNIEGNTEFDGTKVDAWWCPGQSGVKFQLTSACGGTGGGASPTNAPAATTKPTLATQAPQFEGPDRLRRESAGEVISVYTSSFLCLLTIMVLFSKVLLYYHTFYTIYDVQLLKPNRNHLFPVATFKFYLESFALKIVTSCNH